MEASVRSGEGCVQGSAALQLKEDWGGCSGQQSLPGKERCLQCLLNSPQQNSPCPDLDFATLPPGLQGNIFLGFWFWLVGLLVFNATEFMVLCKSHQRQEEHKQG